jgi:hypothetical protein
MTPEEFMKRLTTTAFKGDLRLRTRAENTFSEKMSQFKGYAVHCTQTARAGEVAAVNGYPMQGYALLRNVYDDCVLASGAMQGLTTFEELAGVRPNEDFDEERMRKNRKVTEYRVRRRMDGAESGLSPEVLGWLATIDKMYDMETHGGRLSTAHNMDWLKGASPLAVVPRYVEVRAALFMNRFCEVAWMVHRLLPLMQLPRNAFSTEWGARWRVVDDCFDHMIASLAESLQKPAFAAVREFVRIKFQFNASSRFPS